jgi:serine/threonine-protein kinase
VPDLPDRLAEALKDRYTLQRELGRGGMATVYLATDRKHERSVALKVLKPELAAVLGADRFLREIKTTAQLTHPHILPLLDSGDADGTLFYVMPYVEGESLRDRLHREKQLPVDDALQISREVADALSYAHSRGVIHRDIKPENILLESGHAVVADFGIARAIDAAGADRLTETGVTLGTPAYMSPEQAGGSRDLDGRSDLYSLGCVLYEMLAGQPPFTGPTVESVIHQHLAAEPPNITHLRPSVPGGVVAALQRALAKTPADRFNPVAQFGEAIAPRMSVAEVAPPATAHVGSASRWRRLVLAAAAVVVAVGAWFGARALRSADAPLTPGGPPAYTIVAEVAGTADEQTREVIHRLITVGLGQSGFMTPLPEAQLRQGLALAGRPDSTTVDVQTAVELAIRGAVRTVIAPTVDVVGTRYPVAVQVIEAETGEIIATSSSTAQDADDLIEVIGRAIDELRNDLGERRHVVASDQPLRQVATPSFEAFQKFAQAGSLGEQGRYAQARELLLEALELDPGFSSAWYALATNSFNTGFPPETALAALEQLESRPERLTEQMKLNAAAYREFWIGGDPTAAVPLYQRYVEMTGGGRNQLAQALLASGHPEEAVLVYEGTHAQPFGPGAVDLQNHVEALAAARRLGEAEEKLAALAPYPVRLNRARLWVSIAKQEWSRAESLATAFSDDPLQESVVKTLSAWALVSCYAATGRIVRAQQLMASEVRRDNPRARMAGALFSVTSGLAASTRVSSVQDSSVSAAVFSALDAASSGRVDVARQHLESLARRSDEFLVQRNWRRMALAEALVALAEQNWEGARTRLTRFWREQNAFDWGTLLARWVVAESFEREGVIDSAASYYEMTLVPAPFEASEVVFSGIPYSFAQFRLGRLYTQLEEYDRAKEHYATFLETFTQPDPEYAWMVTEARAKLEDLARGR